jgi:uncharacterized protein
VTTERPRGFLPGQHQIVAYGEGGFKFGGKFGDMSHRGSLLALPSGIYAWEPKSAAEIDESTLARLFAEEQGSVEHILIGTGMELVPLRPALQNKLRAAGIVAEPMATGAAARTYNILLGERRRVAAALIAVG